MNENLSITFSGKITPVKPINDQLTLCKCYVMALGKNRNGTEFSKESVDDALPTLFNIPVVGHLMVDSNGNYRMGGHDMTLEKGNDGKYKFKSLTVPYGTVPQQDNICYEEVTEENGDINTYLVADIVLWTGRFPEIMEAIYSDNTYFAQSMEVTPQETENDGSYLRVNKFQYNALCLLGKSDNALFNVKPCFPSSRVEPYEYSSTAEWNDLFAEFKETMKAFEYENNEGGKSKMEDEIKADDATVIEQVSFEENSDTTVIESVMETFPATEIQTEETVDEPAKYSVDLTYEDKRKALSCAVDNLCIWEAETYACYCLIDFTDKYVYVWYHVSAPDKDECGNERIPYAFSESGVTLSTQEAQSIRQVWLTAEDEAKIAEEKNQYEALQNYKAQRVEEDRRKEFAIIAEEFSDLSELDEYKELVKTMMTFSDANELTKEFYAMRGRNVKKPAKKSLSQIRIPVGIDEINTAQTQVDAFMATYSNKN